MHLASIKKMLSNLTQHFSQCISINYSPKSHNLDDNVGENRRGWLHSYQQQRVSTRDFTYERTVLYTYIHT